MSQVVPHGPIASHLFQLVCLANACAGRQRQRRRLSSAAAGSDLGDPGTVVSRPAGTRRPRGRSHTQADTRAPLGVATRQLHAATPRLRVCLRRRRSMKHSSPFNGPHLSLSLSSSPLHPSSLFLSLFVSLRRRHSPVTAVGRVLR